ncbi:hypothetical protein [Streptomyces syringium]|uniref:hypothetical protein n=1 Tax=Streptomyces syringium TaxID=76729 RepID=UPI0033ABD7CB
MGARSGGERGLLRCRLVLPDSGRFVDATVEQFDEVREIGMGPMVGKVALSIDGDGSLMKPGAQVVIQREGLVLTYTVAGPEALASIVEHPEAVAHADGHRRTGVNVASFTLAALRGEGVRGRAMQAPIRDCEPCCERWVMSRMRQTRPGTCASACRITAKERWLRLDEIPLPPTAPASWPRS